MLSGFTELVPPLVRSAALVYVGMSAGAQLIVVRGSRRSVIPAVP
jgi:hypothetical protein